MRDHRFILLAVAASLAWRLALPLPLAGQERRYQVPSAPLAAVVEAPPPPAVRLSPDRQWLLLVERAGWPTLSQLSERELRLAGRRIAPARYGPSRTRPGVGLSLVSVADGQERPVLGLPQEVRVDDVVWSPDSAHFAFTVEAEKSLELWIARLGDPVRAHRLLDRPLNLTAGVAPSWLPDSSGLLATTVVNREAPEPLAPELPAAPIIEESLGRDAPARTYQDLLKDTHDEALFEHYFTSQLVEVKVDGTVFEIGAPHLVFDVSTSPSGAYLLLESVHRPFSYRVPWSRFPCRIVVVDRQGREVHEVADLPLQEEVPIAFGSVPEGPRNVSWRPDRPATLYWVEALDGGDAGRPSEVRDRLWVHDAPFERAPRSLLTLGLRYAGALWAEDGSALVYERWWQDRKTRTWRLTADGSPADEPLFDRSYEDRYSDPGTPELRANEAGRPVLLTSADGGSLFLLGQGASPEGDRPFLDRFNIKTQESDRLFHSPPGSYEVPVEVLRLDDDGQHPARLLVRAEAPDQPPNFFVHDLKNGERRQLTHYAHPTPQLKGIQKELIRYSRSDGVELSATLYLPPGYEVSQGPLPLLMWAYPREYKSASAASQVAGSPFQFNRISPQSPLVFLAVGYAVLDNPTMPIIGEGDDEPNDRYIEQLVASAEAAVDEVVRRGVTTRERIAIGGHSYGAFMTANLLAHSDLFAAGIARSGAYNRTLTPFGFQSEQRSLWQAPEVYFAMSPFMHADKVNEPILLIHGQLDNNTGTFPMQSERYYAALKGHGATVRLVMLPYESHGYQARESLLHTLWEEQQWLDRWVKKATATADE